MSKVLIQVEDLHTAFFTRKGVVKAVQLASKLNGHQFKSVQVND